MRQTALRTATAGGKLQTREQFEACVGMLGSKGKALKALLAERRNGKRFDGVAFKRKAQAGIYEEIRGMTSAQQLAYFRKKAASGPLAAWWKAAKRRAAARRPVGR